MIKRFLENESNEIREKIKSGNYNFFSIKGLFGFDGDIVRLFKVLYIFISLILNLLIILSILKSKNKKLSLPIKLTGNILIINFIHTFCYFFNWITNLNNAYQIQYKNKTFDIGGLLIGCPMKNFSVCQIQGFMLIWSSLSQDISINIFFYIINKSKIPDKKIIISLIIGLAYIFPYIVATVYAIVGGLGLNDRFCFIKKFYYNYEKGDYGFYDYYGYLTSVIYSFRIINLGLNILFLFKIVKYINKHKFESLYIVKTLSILVVQIITIFIGFLYSLSYFFTDNNNILFSNIFLCIDTLDGILFPLFYSLFNGIYKNLFCNKISYSESLHSLSEGNACFDNSSLNDSINNDKTVAMIELSDEHNFDISF